MLKVLDDIWTDDDIERVYASRLVELIDALGKRPAWFRWRTRRKFDRTAAFMRRLHAQDRRAMLKADVKTRAIVAHLTGRKL